MFSYNQLSDLLNGRLVTPIKKVKDGILCRTEKGTEIIYKPSDFDFNKKAEDRDVTLDTIAEQMEADAPKPEIVEIVKEVVKEVEVIKEVFIERQLDKNDLDQVKEYKKKLLKQAGIYCPDVNKIKISIED